VLLMDGYDPAQAEALLHHLMTLSEHWESLVED
jgi:hypothetical protein